ncbi:hypothetical protein H4Q26_004067 [Puccinia striiformis f. sp. tritici PST-130]|nr:hypothetical protein H4Q26_004067 [Puccinia striiformis f. sp. tritici PST-130]
MNNLTFDSSFPKFSGPDFLRFCGKFTVYTEASVFRSYSATTTEAVVSGSWYGGKDICHEMKESRGSGPKCVTVNKEDLIQVQVFHTNALALNGGIVVRLLLGWDYCHVDRDCKAFIGSRIAYIGLFEGSDRNDGSAIVQGYKAVINFSPSWLDRNALENGVNLSDDFN